MRRWAAPIVLVAAMLNLAACSGPDEAASTEVIDRFHTALNAGDWPAIGGVLARSARNLRPGGAAARACRAITARRGQYVGGYIASITAAGGRTTVAWSARYERGAVSELFVLIPEDGGTKIESYTDNFGH